MQLEPHEFIPLHPERKWGRDGIDWSVMLNERDMHEWWVRRAKLAALATKLPDQQDQDTLQGTIDLIDGLIGDSYSARNDCAVCAEALGKVR